MKTRNKILNGYKALIGSAFSFSLMSICVKTLGNRLPIAELILVRALFSLIVTRVMIEKNRINQWGNNRFLLFTRGIIGTLALFFIFKAISILTLASATVIQYTYPTFAAILAYIFLKESLDRKIIYSIIIGWLGILIIVQPNALFNQTQHVSTYGFLIAISGSLLTALAYIIVRSLSKSEHPLVIIYYFPLVSIPITIPFVLTDFILPHGIEWILLLGIGIFTQVGQILITQGLSIVPAARACAINYSQVIFASIWGITIFGERLNPMVAIGGICVLISTLLTISASKKSTLI